MTAPANIKEMFFETLNGNRTVLEFEKWVYENKELEDVLNPDIYLELISQNYKRSGARHDLYKLLRQIIDPSEFEKWRVLNLLTKALNRDKELPVILMQFYDLYCKGYGFLDNLGLGYGLAVEVPYSMADSWDELSPKQQKDLLDSFYPKIEIEIKKVIDWLESGKVILTGIQDSYDHYEYFDYRNDQEKIPTGYEIAPVNNTKAKPWWKFW